MDPGATDPVASGRYWRCAVCSKLVPARQDACRCGASRPPVRPPSAPGSERLAAKRPPAAAEPARSWPWGVAAGLAVFTAFLLYRAGHQSAADNLRLADRVRGHRPVAAATSAPARPPAPTVDPLPLPSAGVPARAPAGVYRVYSNPNPPAVPVALGFDSYSSDEIGPGAAQAVGAGDEPALLITHVYPGGPSARADLREGDVLLRIDGQATENRDRLQAILGRHRPQDSVEVEFLRSGSTLRATLVLEPMMDLLSRACEAGDASACFAAAIRLRAGIRGSLAPDPARAAALYERACTAGRQDACINLGRLLRRGDDGVEGNPARSAVLFERACQEGVPAGCHNLGILYREGLGVARDPERARALTRQACEGGDADACGRGAEHSP